MNKVFIAVKVILISALLLALVQFFTIPWRVKQLSAQTGPIPTADKGTISQNNDILHQTYDYSNILRYNVFGTLEEDPQANYTTTTQTSPAPGDLGIELLGTVSGHPMIARAIIRESGQTSTSIYKIGDTINHATIKDIHRDSITLSVKGKQVILQRLTLSPSEPSDLYTKTPIKDNIIKTPASQPSVVEQILTCTTLTPYHVDGHVEGIQITGLDKIPLAGVLGLKDGDVIHVVNGQTLTSKQKAFQILKKAKSQRTLDIELLRNGESITLSFPIRLSKAPI